MSNTIAETIETAEISKEDLKNVVAVLKKLSNGWARSMAKKLYPNESEDVAVDKIYNIINARYGKDQLTRINFINAAQQLKEELEQGKNAALNTLKNITN